jgi:formylglycine-generating enzyme required for sulfatase activity
MKRAKISTLLLLFFSFRLLSQETTAGFADIAFIQVEPGSFLYGKYDPPYPTPAIAPENNYRARDFALAKKLAQKAALPGFMVHIEKPFYIGKFEITGDQWKKVMGDDPSVFKGDGLPVENISWDDAQRFLAKLNELDTAHYYRLPTEFEWEYAARAGATDDISWDEIRLQAQIGLKSPAPVGQKKPNAWGLYDMLGNVWEWTSDWYNEKMFGDPVPPKTGDRHVLKGASFVGDVKNATYMTHAAGPGNGWDVGLRVVMERRETGDGRRETGDGRRETGDGRRETGDGRRETAKRNRKSPVPGWHISRTSHQGTTPYVRYKKGIITVAENPYGQGGVLLTDKKYKDFELTVEVKIDSFSNGGIFLRSTESGQAYQVELAEPGGTGDVFGEMMSISKPGRAENKAKAWKANDWNKFRIRMTGSVPRIQVWINDALMYDITEPANDFTAGAVEGMIGLQAHWSVTYSSSTKAFDMSGSWRPGSKHRFRNLKIKEL